MNRLRSRLPRRQSTSAEGNMAEDTTRASLLACSEPVFDLVCIPCNDDGKICEAKGYCTYCCEHLCAQCLQYHKRLSALRHHKLVDKVNMPLVQTVSVVKDVCTDQCSIHRNKFIEYYCTSHKVLGCSVCMTLKHKQCKDTAYIPEVSADFEHSQEYKTFKQHLEQLIQKADVVISSAEQKLKMSVDLYRRIQQYICSFRQEINTALDKLETDIEKKLDQINKTFKQHIDQLFQKSEVIISSVEQTLNTSAYLYRTVEEDTCTSRQEINTDKHEIPIKEKLSEKRTENTKGPTTIPREANRVIEQLQTISANFQELIRQKHNCKLFTQMKSTEGGLLQLHDTLKKIDNTPLQVYRFRPNKELLQLLKETDVFGKLFVRNTREIRAASITDINVRSKRNTETCRISGISVVSREKLVVTDSLNCTVKLIDLTKTKKLSELQLTRFPWTVTAINNAKVAVTQLLCCEILFLTCDDKLKVDTTVSVQGECRGIAYYQNKLIVTFDKPSKLEILSLTGKVLRRFENDDQGIPLLVNPYYVSVDREEPSIFVSDWDNHSLIKLSMNGNVLAVYNDRELSSPGQCVIDQAGLVYLCGEKSHNIHLLTAECTQLKTILTPKDGLWEPKAISYCENTGRLYVGMKYNDNIKAYQIND